ncbi:MAG TPA: hypothetical protein VM012_14925 [Flavitalea sp.]|nr:hypothetical protein [Flavitalea sp.]
MNAYLHMLGLISFGLLELIVFQLGAVGLGFAIHFFWTSRKNLPPSAPLVRSDYDINEADEWRLKYYEQLDVHEKQSEKMRRDVKEATGNEKMLRLEIEELNAQVKELQLSPPQPEAENNYMHQLVAAQENLSEHNEKVNRLLEQVEMLRHAERKHQETHKTNESLLQQLRESQHALSIKDNEVRQIRKQQGLAHELDDRLRKVFEEFNLMQDKVITLENHLAKPQMRGFEYEDLQQAYFRLTKEFDEIKGKQLAMLEENQRLSRLLADTEDKLREANFVRQQLSKKVTFLDELNTDLQQVATQNKKIEMQLKRIAEIEQLLKKVPEKENEPPPDK